MPGAPPASGPSTAYEFEGYRLEPSGRRLSKDGRVVPLTPRTFDTLLALVRNRGRVLATDEALRLVWPDASGEESSLAQNVFALRKALGDTSDAPRFVEAVPPVGYRFVAEVRESRDGILPATSRPGRGWARAILLALLLPALVVAVVFLAGRRSTEPPTEPEYRKLTFRRGFVRGARFGPDGAWAVYSASWDGQAPRIFAVGPSQPEGEPLDLPEADLLAVSHKGELAILLRPPMLPGSIGSFATLARAAIGGEPREVITSVNAADWGPDGESLAVVRLIENRIRRLEYPVGSVLYETAPADCIDSPRVSPDGRLVAFVACKEAQPSIVVVDRAGNVRRLVRSLRYVGALAWSPGGDEIWYSVGAAGLSPELRAVGLDGRDRVIARGLAGTIEDVAKNGRVLVSRGSSIWGVRGVAPGETEERELSWVEGSAAVDLSNDGRLVLFGEALEGGAVNGRIYLRATDGSPAVHLADGFPACLSPDGRRALVKQAGLTDYTLVPTGAGESRQLEAAEFRPYLARWFPDGQRILWGAELPGRPGRLWVQDVAGGRARPLTPERTGVGVISPDGRTVATIGDDGHFLYPTAGGERRPLRGPEPEEWPIQWGDDGRLYVARQDQLPVRVMRVDVATGRRELWRELGPSDRGGILGIRPLLTRDAKAYVYTYNRLLSDLFEVRGLR
jgi:DNA-binding winged helix-turn-helix (wHTH) protein